MCGHLRLEILLTVYRALSSSYPDAHNRAAKTPLTTEVLGLMSGGPVLHGKYGEIRIVSTVSG
eukprot:4118535-Prymnesium_polylepis.1